MTDEELADYLNNVDEYLKLKTKASNMWKSAYLHLSKARLSFPCSSSDYDPNEEACVTVDDANNVTIDENAQGPILKPWAPSSLKNSRKAFLSALGAEIECYKMIQKYKLRST